MADQVLDMANGWLAGTVDDGKEEIRKAWDKLKAKEQGLVIGALRDIATLRIREAGGQNITRELAFAKATLVNMKVVAEIVLYNAFLNVLENSLKQLGSILSGIAGGLRAEGD